MEQTTDLRQFMNEVKEGNLQRISEYAKEEYESRSRAVHWAASNGQVNILQWLMDHNVDMESVSNKGLRAVHSAAFNGHVNILEWLMDHSFDMNAVDNDGLRAVHWAAFNGQVNILQWLMDHSFDMNAVNNSGSRAVHSAAMNGHVNILQWLMDHSFDMEAVCDYGSRAVHSAAFNGHVNILQWLMDHSFDMEAVSNDGLRAVHCASINGHVNILQWLMDHSFDMNAVDNYGSRAVHYAAFNGHVNILQWLMDHSFDMEAVNNIGSKVINIAAQNGHLDIIEWLTEHEFNLEAEDNDGSRAVHYAAYNGHIDILQWLKKHDCDMEAMNNNVSRPVHYARDNGHKNILKLLKDNNCDMSPRTNVYTPSLDLVTQQLNIPRFVLSEMNQSVDHALKRIELLKPGCHLGAGGFGTVSRHTDKEVDIAIKSVSNDEDLNSARNEIAIYEMLPPHPRIVKYLGTRRDRSGTHICMEPMPGGSLEHYLIEHGPLDSGIITQFTKQILEGLDFLHSNKIIHRDIRCANILRDTQNNIKICDFGISRYLKSPDSKTVYPMRPLCDGNHGDDITVCMANTWCGSTYWMAPEVIRGEPYSTWVDVWSLGATVIEMLTGKHPYPDLSPELAIMRIGNRSSIEYTHPKPISTEFQAFINQMLAPDPQQRATVKDLLKSDFILDTADQ